MTENEKTELFDKWYDENYDKWAEGEEGIALREELEQAFKGGIAELENKIADIKANCDLAIEGRDIKIKELTDRLEELQEQNSEMFNTIALQEQQIEKMKKYGKLLQDICTVMGNEVYMVAVGLENRVKVLWDSSEEKEGLKMVEDIENRLLKIKPQDWAEIDEWEIKENDR